MTTQEIENRTNELLDQLPPEFRGPVSYYAYEQGHAYGEEEVLGKLEGLVDMLKKPTSDMLNRIRRLGTKGT